jgi:hypothetical protein
VQPLCEEVAECVVFFVEGEDCRVRDAWDLLVGNGMRGGR